MKAECGAAEQLKADDQWHWIMEVGSICGIAEAFVLCEMVQ